jgi:exonuclease VII large subunit
LREWCPAADNILTANRHPTYLAAMDQTQPRGPLRTAGGESMSKASSAKERVDDALSRLETMVDERLREERERGDELARRLNKLERDHDELRKVAVDVEGRLERAMEYIRSLLAADQK